MSDEQFEAQEQLCRTLLAQAGPDMDLPAALESALRLCGVSMPTLAGWMEQERFVELLAATRGAAELLSGDPDEARHAAGQARKRRDRDRWRESCRRAAANRVRDGAGRFARGPAPAPGPAAGLP